VTVVKHQAPRCSLLGRFPRGFHGALLPLLLSLGCATNCEKRPPPVHGARDAGGVTRPLSASAIASVAPAPLPPSETTFRALLEQRRFDQVWDRLQKLPAEKKSGTYTRLTVGFVGSRVGQPEGALSALTDLELSLPEHQRLIERLRAKANLQTTSWRVGAEWLAAHGEPEGWLAASETAVRVGKPEDARAAIERALALPQGGGARPNDTDRARLRLARARLLETSEPSVAAADYCFVAVEAPSEGLAVKADAACERLGKRPLTNTERRNRLRALAAAGAVEAVDREGETLAKLKVQPLSEAERALLRGRARSVGRVEHLEGARLLQLAVRRGVENPATVLFEAARLLQRGGDAPQAIQVYDRLGKLYPGNRSEAAYYAARTCLGFGRPKEAATRYESYLRHERRAERTRLATLEQSLAMLLSGSFDKARRLLLTIARTELGRDTSETGKLEGWAMATELAGVAAWSSGQKKEAVALWQEVITKAPLNLFALFARSRLRTQAEAFTSPFGDAIPVQAEGSDSALPPLVKNLHDVGLVDLAAAALGAEESRWESSLGERGASTLCNAWGTVGTADRRYARSRDTANAVFLVPPVTETRWQWDCRYPRPYESMVEEVAREQGVASELVFGVMRQESGYRPAVRSPVGATGLLQLMPTTAERLAQVLSWDQPGDLEEPRVNVTLGAHYLKRLLDAFGQNPILAVASYNAGPEVVSHWVRAQPHTKVDVYAALIPYAETRGYVNRVLSNLATYLYLGGGEAALPKLELTFTDQLPASGSLY
jgi:soluble lytic murein transglycosylase